MDVFKTMDVIGSGLTAERTRINAVASNIANANTVGYKRKDVVLESVPENDFDDALEAAGKGTSEHTQVRVVDVKEDTQPLRLEYKPDHPRANAEGYVEMPNVNPIEETANMISARQAFEANVNVFQTTKQMALKALEIGR